MNSSKSQVSLVKKLEALSKISKAISSELYLEDILRLIVVVTAEVMKSKICSLWLLDERDKALKIRATQSMSEEYLKERSLKLGEGVVGYVAQENKPMMTYTLPPQNILRPGAYDVYISVGDPTGLPTIALPLPGDDGSRRYRLGKITVTPASPKP